VAGKVVHKSSKCENLIEMAIFQQFLARMGDTIHWSGWN